MSDLKKIYAALDIGNNYIKGVVAEVFENKIFVLASSMVTSDGIVNGVIESEKDVIKKIKEVIKDLSSMVGVEINNVILGVLAFDVSMTNLYGETYITSDDSVIKAEDVQRSIVNATKKFKINGNEIVNAVPLRYNIDGYEFNDALGCRGSKLGVDLLVLSVPAKIIYPYLTVVEKSGVNVLDICLSPLADKFEILSQVDCDSSLIINLGFSHTSMIINSDSKLKGIATFSIGLKKLVDSLVAKFGIHPVHALDFINNYGVSDYDVTGDKIKLKKVDNEECEFDLLKLINHTEKMMLSLLVSLQDKVNSNKLDFYDKIIVTGGITEMIGFESLCNQVFDNGCEIYRPKYIGGRNSGYTTAFGLIRYIVNKNEVRGRVESSINSDLQLKISTPKKKVLNLPEDSVLGKLIEYFF
ncbi:MAG: hypothetical protein ACK5NF_01550 [Bacilli bacterium]